MSSDIYRDSIFWVEVERIKPNPFQPRREFDQAKLQELGDSIRMYGLLQPLTVTRTEIPRDDGGISVEYELIAGERRLRASKLAGLAQVPVIIRSGEETDQMKLELAIIENLQREDLNPVDRAKAFDKLYREFKFTHIEIGRKVGKSREYVSNTLRLLTLPEPILIYIAEGRITEGHTRPLLMLNDRPEEQQVLAKQILLQRLTVRESEAIARRIAQDRVTAKHKINPEILALERALTEKLGTRVQIEPREVGGRLVISFFSAEDLHALLESIRVEHSPESASAFNVPTSEVVAETMTLEAEDDAGPLALEQGLEASTDEPTESQDAAAMVVAAMLDAVPSTSSEDAILRSETLPDAGGSSDETGLDASGAENDVPAEMPATVPTIGVTPSPVRPQPTQEESDLYSIRNFSI